MSIRVALIMRTDVTWEHEVFICFPRVLGGVLVTNPCARKLFPLITSTRSFMPIVRTNVHAGHTHFNSTYIPPHTPFVYTFHSWCTWKHLSHAVVLVYRDTHMPILSLFFLFVSANLSVNIRLFQRFFFLLFIYKWLQVAAIVKRKKWFV